MTNEWTHADFVVPRHKILMKVKELIKLLETEDPDRIVVMSKDSEGNNFSPLTDLGNNTYVPSSGDIYCEREEDGKPPAGYSDEDCYDGDDGEPALVLWPV